MKKSCNNCGNNKCRNNTESKNCFEELENWIKKKECQINAIERTQFGCQLECIAGYDCIYYQ